jgi:hypothetical protein
MKSPITQFSSTSFLLGLKVLIIAQFETLSIYVLHMNWETKFHTSYTE